MAEVDFELERMSFSRADIRSFSLGLGVIQDFIKLRPDTQAKNIAAWMPVIAKILDGFNRLDEKAVCNDLSSIFASSLSIVSSSCAIFLGYTLSQPICSREIFRLLRGPPYETISLESGRCRVF